MEELELLQGTVAAVVYQNHENGYAVLRLSLGRETVTVVGTIPLAVPGERLMVTGRWANNANYGRQFEAEFLERLMPETTPEILSYLSSRTVKGIGPKLAAAIIDERERNGAFRYWEDLICVRGIGEKSLRKLEGQLGLP